MKRILWFRRDLRARDNALLQLGGEVLPIFIFDSNILQTLHPKDKRVNFIFDAVIELKRDLRKIGLELAVFYGKPVEIIPLLTERYGIEEVCVSGDYDGYARERDWQVAQNIELRFLDDTYMFQPEEILKADKTPYLVFTPFYNRAKVIFCKWHLLEKPISPALLIAYDYEGLHVIPQGKIVKLSLESIGFEYSAYDVVSAPQLLEQWAQKIEDYEKKRDFLDLDATSQLSVHLRFGTLGIRELLRFLALQRKQGVHTEPFFRQLVFREFYAYLLFHFPSLEHENFKYHFYGEPNAAFLKAFCSAKTGVPIVDAAVSELLLTGKMHNRARMIAASFFTKDLLLPWQQGEQFFAAHLLDYDAASNLLSWQWSASTGVDAQPYFRIFNPYTQGKKFDANALYIKKWLPHLADISPEKLHDETFLLQADIHGYPKPVVIHKMAALKAKEAFKQV
jgi:deoxyribodipyrimidine photo-lyase